MLYYLIFTVFLILSFASNYTLNKENNNILTIFSTALLAIIAAIRDNTGSDFQSYESIWNDINPLNIAITEGTGYQYLEPGFRYTVSFLKLFSDSGFLFFSFFSILSLILLVIALLRFNYNPLISIFLYFSIFYMPYIFNVMRQGLAMSIFLVSLEFILERKLLQTVLLSMLAASFHITGILIIISYFLVPFFQRVKPIFLLTIGSFIASIFTLSNVSQRIFLFFFPSRSDSFIILQAENTSLLQVFVRLLLILSFIYLGTYLRRANFNTTYRYLINLYIFGFLIYIAFFDFNLLATRFNMFLRILEIIIIPILLFHAKNNITKPVLFFYYLLIGIAYFIANVNNPANDYQTIFGI